MKSFVIFVAVVFLFGTSAQSFDVSCNYQTLENVYYCIIEGATVADDENANIVFGGTHQTNRSNVDVERVEIRNSNIPFVMTQIFTTFPNLRRIEIRASGLARIQSNAFSNAGHLDRIYITGHTQLTAIYANAFSGAVNVEIVDLGVNGIQTIHETAFDGVENLVSLIMDTNRIRELPADFFSNFPLLETINLSDNQLSSLNGRFFANNRQLININVVRNQIDGIGWTILDGLDRLRLFDARQNLCVNDQWRLWGPITVETIRHGLAACFSNPSIDPRDIELRRFVLEIRGGLSLRLENGTEVLRI